MPQITPFLWFDSQAEEAARFYTGIFPASRIVAVHKYGEGSRGVPGTVMSVGFELAGHHFTALNGGPVFEFSSATSFVIHCADAAEVDHYWDRLLDGGTPSACGWLVDRFGVTWQVVPEALLTMLADSDPAKVRRVTEAMLKMVKLDLPELERAYRG